MIRNLTFLIALALSVPALAQMPDLRCQSSPRSVFTYDPRPAQGSLPALIRNVFASDPTATVEGLEFTVLIPAEMTPGCPAGSL